MLPLKQLVQKRHRHFIWQKDRHQLVEEINGVETLHESAIREVCITLERAEVRYSAFDDGNPLIKRVVLRGSLKDDLIAHFLVGDLNQDYDAELRSLLYMKHVTIFLSDIDRKALHTRGKLEKSDGVLSTYESSCNLHLSLPKDVYKELLLILENQSSSDITGELNIEVEGFGYDVMKSLFERKAISDYCDDDFGGTPDFGLANNNSDVRFLDIRLKPKYNVTNDKDVNLTLLQQTLEASHKMMKFYWRSTLLILSLIILILIFK